MTTTTTPLPGTASKRIYNFSAGPATLPEEVIKQAQIDLWDLDGTGIGILEHSHRGKAFDRVIEETEANCRAVGSIGEQYAVLFLQGGASTQFATIPMSFLPDDRTADYADTGVWATKAIKEARRLGNVHVAFDGSATNYDHTPDGDELDTTGDAAYFHYCSNNTIYGTRFPEPPTVETPLIADMSSEIYSRAYDIKKHVMIYAGAQKNLGPAGVTLVIIDRAFLERARPNVPSMFDYRKQVEKGSRLNTPPTFAIYVMGLVFKWILKSGGLAAVSTTNDAKARIVYDAIDQSGGFYRPVAQPRSRSTMNVTFRTPSTDLDAKFVTEALEHDMSGLKGHRDVGGLRASIYNAFPIEGCEALAQFMADFAKRA